MSDSKIIHVGEHIYQTPELTRDSEVLFKNFKSKDAYWRREVLLQDYREIWFQFIPNFTLMDEKMTTYNSDDVLVSLNKEDSDYIMRIYEQEIRRRTFGVWFKNGEVAGKENYEYITGDNYFFLMWAKMNVVGGGEYPEFREYQRDYFYLIDAVWKSKRCTGLFVSKAKKTGITNLHWIYYLNKATLLKNQNLGCMNINKDQAAKTFRDYFLLSFNGLPAALKPQVNSKAPQEGNINFGLSHKNSKANKHKAIQNSDEELNSNVFCVATADKSFDVAVNNDIWFDEAPKYDEPFESIYSTNKESVTISGFQNGRSWITSYTPDKDGQSFREARQIFQDSALKTIKDTGTGKTKSGLWRWHIPSYVSWFGEDGKCFDKNGKCNEARAIKEIDAGRVAVKDNPRKYQSLKRQYAKNIKEAWASAGEGSVFDNDRLGELEQDLIIMEEENPAEAFEEGFLEWTNKFWEIGTRTARKRGEFCNVEWVPLTDEQRRNGIVAPFRKYYDIPLADRNLALKNGRDQYGNLLPPQRYKYAIGGDPTAYATKGETMQYSKNGGGAIRIPNVGEDILNNQSSLGKRFSIEYYDRPELPNVGYECWLKLIIYTGGLALIEGNQKWISTQFMEEGIGYYMLVIDKEDNQMKVWKPYMGMVADPEKTYQFIQIGRHAGVNPLLEYMVRLFSAYFHYPQPGEFDMGKTCKTSRLLKQMQDLDTMDTTKSDLFMGWGYALIVLDVYLMLLMIHPSQDKDRTLFRATLSALGSMRH